LIKSGARNKNKETMLIKKEGRPRKAETGTTGTRSLERERERMQKI
jgi:hypothetical protein